MRALKLFLSLCFRGYSLMVMKIKSLSSLGFRSLQKVNDGVVYITGNKKLCYQDTVNWTRIVNNRPRQKRQKFVEVKENRPSKECGKGHERDLLEFWWMRWSHMFLLLCVQLRKAMCVTRCALLMAVGVLGQTSVLAARTTAEEGHACQTACSYLG